MTFKSINPYNLTLIENHEPYDWDYVDGLIRLSTKSYSSWSASRFGKRRALMKNLAALLKERKKELATIITLEMGKPITESVAEIEKCAWVCGYYAKKAKKFLKSRNIETDASNSYVNYAPLGPVLAIMPWNFPFWQVFRFAAPGIMAGNTCLLKHASNVSRCALEIEKLFADAGYDKGIFKTLLIPNTMVQKVIEHDGVKAVTLTGSEKAGSSVASIAGANIKKSLLELGGSNAFIVMPDADIQQAVKVGVKARFLNTGQSCIAAKRFLLHASIADQYLELFKKEIDQLVVGDPMNKTTTLGPLARVDLAESLEKQVNTTLEQGGQLLIGGERDKAYYPASVLTNTGPGMASFEEEVFGPVASVTTFKNTEEAIRLTNHSTFGLGASIFTNDLKKARKMANKIEDGAVFVNSLVKSDPRLPFGGTKRSGYGRELSKEGIREFTNVKTVFLQ